MAKQRQKQSELIKTGPSKLRFDGEEDGWVLVKKQRVIIVLPSLPLPNPFIAEKPETSQSQAELRDIVVDTQEATLAIHTAVPEHFILQNPETSQSQAELPDVIATPTEHFILQKPATSQSQAKLRDVIANTVAPSLPPPEHLILQKSATSQSQAQMPSHCTLQKPATFQPKAELRENTHKSTLLHTAEPSPPLTHTLQKPSTSQSQAKLRDIVTEPKICPDFTSVDKPEILIMNHNLKTRKARARKRSHQDYRMDQKGQKPIRFRRVMCNSVGMDNEKLRIVNLEKKVEKAGGLNEWVGSIGLGRDLERIIKGEKMSKYELANLTMEKLKKMGALAVGPRRKLIHAIRCVYHPHCLRAFF